jgi:hypothetical protein
VPYLFATGLDVLPRFERLSLTHNRPIHLQLLEREWILYLAALPDALSETDLLSLVSLETVRPFAR